MSSASGNFDAGLGAPAASTDLTEAQLIMDRADALAAVSARPDGIERVYLSPQHKQVDTMAAAWMEEAGLATWMDAAGSRLGRLEGREPGLPALVLGSHLDTVPDAGRYDGILGVLLSIAVAKRLASRQAELPFAVEVIAFHEEEGVRFGATLLGSRAMAGTWEESLFDLTDPDGVSLREAFTAFGLDPARVGEAARKPEDLVGYLEAHIEQGPALEAEDLALGVVTSIAGAQRFEIEIDGVASHAGGTPFDRRHDALLGASEFALAVERICIERGTIGTVGHLEIEPGAVNVVPGRAVLSLDLRASDDPSRDAARAEIEAALAEICERRGLTFQVHLTHSARSVLTAPDLQEAVRQGIKSVDGGNQVMELWSRAGHDAMAVADVTDVAMMFIRCKDGISHSPLESVTVEDVAAALDAFEAAVLAYAGQVSARS